MNNAADKEKVAKPELFRFKIILLEQLFFAVSSH